MDTFFSQENCDRCGKKLIGRTMSWFNKDTICVECSSKEKELKAKLPDHGRSYEGCGYIPKIG